MVQIYIEVNRGLSRENWNSIEPFALELIGKENRCCVCGKPQVSPFVRIHGLDVREARIAVGLFHCSDHSDYDIKDYTLVNGIMILRKPNWEPMGKWFNLPWWEFKKIVYSRTPFADAFPRFELNRAFFGVGNLCLKTVELEKIPDSYVIKKSEPMSVKQENSETRTLDNIYHHDFWVPTKVYSDKEYYEKLNNARTVDEVERILRDYEILKAYKHQPNEKGDNEDRREEAQTNKHKEVIISEGSHHFVKRRIEADDTKSITQEQPKKKKHWWNKS